MSTDATNEYLIEQLEKKDERIDELTDQVEELRAEINALRNGEADIDRSNMPETNDELVEQFITDKNRTNSTARQERQLIHRVTEWFDGTHLADMAADDFLMWARDGIQADASESTLYGYLGSFGQIYEWMGKKDWINGNPAREAREIGGFDSGGNAETGLGSDEIESRLSEAQAGRVVSQIVHPRNRAVFVLGFKNGLRAQSLRMLRRDDVNLDTKTIVDRHPKGQGDDPKNPATGSDKVVLPIDSETVTVLREWFDVRDSESEWVFPGQDSNDPLGRRSITHAVTDATDDIANRTDGELSTKLQGFTCHYFRYSFVKHMRKNDIDEYILQRLRGDQDQGMNDLYDERDRDEIRETFDNLVMKFNR